MKAPALISILLLATGSATTAAEEARQPAECPPATGKPCSVSRSFEGIWRLDVDKNKLTGETYTIDQTAPGKFRFDRHGFVYEFDRSGKECPMPDGDTVAVESPEPDRFSFTVRRNDEILEGARLPGI